LTGAKPNRPGRVTFAVVAAIAIGVPVIVVVASVWNGTLWPSVPILIGSWILAMLIFRSFVVYQINLGPFRKQRETARQEIARLEARIDEVEPKSRDKN